MEELYQQYRALLFKLAYQMTGSVADAEDVVQDVFLKVSDRNPEHLEAPKAYLCKMVTNRCLDLLKSAPRRREQYVGPWLPEPLPTLAAGADLFESVEQNDLLSYAMLVLLERLSPAERSVFVLREALGFDYPTISDLVGKREEHCRKLTSRARARMGIAEADLPRGDAVGEAWLNQFLSALDQGDAAGLISLLSEDVTLTSDGGGKVTAATQPIRTRDHVARYLLGLRRKLSAAPEVRIELTGLNGETGIVLRSGDAVVGAALLHADRGAIRQLFFVVNPEKLAGL